MSKESVKIDVAQLDDVLKMIDRVNETFTYEVWVPSLGKNVMFRELNTSQQKRIIKSIIDSPVYNTEFIFAFRKVLKENCADPEVNIGSLTILDKLFIALKMRSVSVGDGVELTIKLDEAGKNTVKRGISLEKLLTDATNSINLPNKHKVTDSSGIYTLTCSIPTIDVEFKLEDELRKNVINREKIDNTNELRETVGDVFIGEISKYIETIEINNGTKNDDGDDQITLVDLNSLSFRNRISIIERLPKKVTEKVIKYIETVKAEIDKVKIVKINIGTEEEPIWKEETLSIDGSFFTVS